MSLIHSAKFSTIDNTFPSNNYPIFAKNKDQLSARIGLIFGRNGSGKTTFAEALASKIDPPEGGRPAFLDEAGNEISTLPETPENFIHLFNEEYIIANFRVSNKHVEALVLFGEQVNNDDQIGISEKKIDDAKKELNDIQTKRTLLEASASTEGSIKNAESKVRAALKAVGWQERQKTIRNSDTDPRITSSVLTDLKAKAQTHIEASTEEDTLSLGEAVRKERKELTHLLTLIEAASTPGAQKIQLEPAVAEIKKTLKSSANIITKIPPTMPTTDLANKVHQHLSDGALRDGIQLAREQLLHQGSDTCPTCLQKLDKHYLTQLREALTAVFNNARNEIEEDLKKCKQDLSFPTIELSGSTTDTVSPDSLAQYEKSKNAFESKLDIFLSAIELKINDVTTIPKVDISTVEDKFSEYKSAHEKINLEIDKYNKSIDDLKENCLRATELDCSVTAYDCRAELRELLDKEERSLNLDQEEKEKENTIEVESLNVSRLKARQKDLTVAADLINEFVRLIFADENRIKLEVTDEGYAVRSRGQTIAAKQLSTGERNILALSYFFASIFDGVDDYNAPEQRKFVILDDPLSSFDSDNQYGVFIFLRQITQKILAAPNSQVLILSHDLRLIQNFAATCKTINSASTSVKLLTHTGLQDLNLETDGPYDRNLRKIYTFATLGTAASPVEFTKTTLRQGSADEENRLSAELGQIERGAQPTGNEIRQVLEAFFEFNFGRNISDALDDRHVRSLLENESLDFAKYFSGPLYKLILHGESHTADATRAGDFNVSLIIDDPERVWLCREMLCLIHALYPRHISARLRHSADQASKTNELLLEWAQQVENRVLPKLPLNRRFASTPPNWL